MSHKSLIQLLCAALVDTNFRKGLLSDPASATSGGYLDHVFLLSAEEHIFVSRVKAQALQDFSSQVSGFISNNNDPSRLILDAVSLAELGCSRHAPLFELKLQHSTYRH